MAARRPRKGSIFSQKLDQVAFIAYFLGAVVPLAALGLVVQRYVLPTLRDRFAASGLIGAVVSIAVLSLASFLTLRLTTRRSLQRMDADNHRLAALLRASGSLAAAEYGNDAAETSARTALVLTGARAAWALVRRDPDAPLERVAAAGEDPAKLEQHIAAPLLALAELVTREARPALRGADADAPAMAAAPLPGETAPLGALVCVAADGVPELESSAADALATLAGLGAVALRNADLRHAQRNFFTHVTEILVTALDAHRGYHEGHGSRVAQYANRIGRKLGLDDTRLQRLHFAALLHDIGMLKLDPAQQNDPRAAAPHTVIGARMLARIRLWEDLAPIVQHHHEWWDGSGYPDRLAGPAIPLESRIIGLCDAFDAITSGGSYQVALPLEAAVREIERCAGTQFDPEVARVFADLVASGEMGVATA